MRTLRSSSHEVHSTLGTSFPSPLSCYVRKLKNNSNIGVWVGPQFFDALRALIPGAAFQGVDQTAYPADLKGYLEQGGSDSGAESLQTTVDRYAELCPDRAIVVAGWRSVIPTPSSIVAKLIFSSQGALVVHKGLAKVSPAGLKHVAAVVVFGDPNQQFGDKPFPSSISENIVLSRCVNGTVFDPLCAKLPGDFKVPTSISDITGPFNRLPKLAVSLQQSKAAASLLARFIPQLSKSLSGLVKTLWNRQIMRMFLSPQHFTYGNNGMAKEAAEFVAERPGVKKAMAAKHPSTSGTYKGGTAKKASTKVSAVTAPQEE